MATHSSTLAWEIPWTAEPRGLQSLGSQKESEMTEQLNNNRSGGVGNIFCSVLVISFWRRQWPPTPVLLPGKSHGWRSLVGCSPWGRKESDTTERLHFHFSLSCIGEGNGNPFQCSCLENPRDGGAWWLPSVGSHRVGHD